MKRIKRHKVKREELGPSTSCSRVQEEHDLAYYIHDRVELMHQVFSVLKPKELKAMAPECVRHISVDDLEELCLEELLGISSKRLCAIMDGAEPPSDTESSSPSTSPAQLETISLDSISSDDEILSQTSSKKVKKHKHRRRESKSKSKSKRKKDRSGDEQDERSRASRAGLTVLELLELQARARAIRAQLQQEQGRKAESIPASSHQTSDDDEVEIKEEPAEVVEISSEDEKPNIEELEKNIEKGAQIPARQPASVESENDKSSSKTVTKKINDLIITVPQCKPTRKIKLKRNNVTVSVANAPEKNKESTENRTPTTNSMGNNVNLETNALSVTTNQTNGKDKRKKQKKKKKRNSIEKDSDHDEITLQLSDTEKMDLLEDLDRKTYDKLSSSSADSESSSDTDNDQGEQDDMEKILGKKITSEASITSKAEVKDDKHIKVMETPVVHIEENQGEVEITANTEKAIEFEINVEIAEVATESEKTGYISADKGKTDGIEVTRIEDIPVVEDKPKSSPETISTTKAKDSEDVENRSKENISKVIIHITKDKNQSQERELSEGELAENESSEVESFDVQPEVVCISDDDGKSLKKKKNKKKDKKSKREKKKDKKNINFPESSDQDFYREETTDVQQGKDTEEILESNDVNEILELSDDSSCYEVEGTILSEDPTVTEIEALSAKIDEIKQEEIIIDDESRDPESTEVMKETINPQNEEYEDINISWKERYLGSKKVKKVLSTSNILNALRKKNKELKKKIAASKTKETDEEQVEQNDVENTKELEEGSIEQFNTLQGSTKYVCPAQEQSTDNTGQKDGNAENNVKKIEKADTESQQKEEKLPEFAITGEMKKDAKQLFRMYKKLLKYNNMNKQKDPNKKKKKKKEKRNKDKDGGVVSVATVESADTNKNV